MENQSGTLGGMFVTVPAAQGTHFAYPAFGRPRLFLPVERPASAAGKTFFFSTLKRFKLNAVHLAGLVCNSSPKYGLREAKWLSNLKEHVGNGAVRIAAYPGTPGPYSKATVLLMDKENQPVAVGKAAKSANAIRLLNNEWTWLRRFMINRQLEGRVPTPIAIRYYEKFLVVIQSPGRGLNVGRALSTEVVAFLVALQESSITVDRFSASSMFESMCTRYGKVYNAVLNDWKIRIDATLMKLERGFEGKPIPTCAAHRDFVPWNMRLMPGGVFVFDWEYASDGYLPLYDMFHFLLMPVALHREILPSDIAKLFRNADELSTLLPGTAGVIPDYQLLAYLLDLSLFYLEANVGLNGDTRVLDRYARAIDEFDTWRLA